MTVRFVIYLRAFVTAWLLAVSIGLQPASQAWGQSTELRFIEGLRARRLFDLAAEHCREQLSQSELDPLEQAELTGQLIRIYGEQGMHAAGDQRAAWWQKAHDTADEFASKFSDHPRLLVVRVQDALVLCAEGELLRQEAEAARGDASERFAVALESLLRAARALEDLDEEIGEAIPAAPKTTQGMELTADEWFALRNHVRLELARVYRHRGACYPEGPDRIAAITQALEPLNHALTQLPADDPLAWRARLEQAICLRMSGSSDEAHRALNSLTGEGSPADLAGAIRAEEIRAAVEARRFDVAISKATQQLPPGAGKDPEFVLARLEAIIAQWQLSESNEPEKSAEWRQQAVSLTKYIEQTHGGYWGRRAEQLLLRSASSGSGAGDVEILLRRADDLYHRAQLSQAVAAYDEAAEAAASAGLSDEEFLCRFRAALVEQKTGNLQAALDRFQQLALKLSAHSQASAAHLEAIKVAVELARNDSEHLPLYEQLLLEHLQHWAAGATADQVRVWLGRLYAHARRWEEASAVYTAISLRSAQAPEAVAGALGVWREQLTAEKDNPRRAAMLERAVAYLQAAADAENAALLAPAAIGVGQILLEFAPSRASEALPLLEKAAASEVAPSDVVQRDALESLIIAVMAVDPMLQSQAAARLQAWQSRDPEITLALAQRLSMISRNLPAQQQQSLAKLQLQLLARLRATVQDEGTLAQLLPLEALALAAAGDRSRALATFAEAAKRWPRDGHLQLQYARLLEQGSDRASWNAALTQWSNVALHSPKQSDAWYEAKMGVARARLGLGNAEQAVVLLRLILETAPPPADSPWDRKLRQLLAECQAAQKKSP